MKLQQIHRPSCVAMEKDLRKMNLNARVNDSMLGKVRFTATANIIINYTFFFFLCFFFSALAALSHIWPLWDNSMVQLCRMEHKGELSVGICVHAQGLCS